MSRDGVEWRLMTPDVASRLAGPHPVQRLAGTVRIRLTRGERPIVLHWEGMAGPLTLKRKETLQE